MTGIDKPSTPCFNSGMENTLIQRLAALTDGQLLDLYMESRADVVAELVEAIEEEASYGERYTLDALEECER